MPAIPLPNTAPSTVQPVSAAMAWAAAMVSRETRFSLPSRCSATTRIVSAISLIYLPFLFLKAPDHQHERYNNVSPEQDPDKSVARADVPVRKKQPAKCRNQHDNAHYHECCARFVFGCRKVIPAFRIVFHSFHGPVLLNLSD